MPRITERVVQQARPRSRKYEIRCSSLGGFVLRVLPSGKKVYYVRRFDEGADTRTRIGPVESMTLSEAQAKARSILFDDVREDRRSGKRRGREASPRVTVREFSQRYLTEYVDRHLKATTRAKYRDHLRHILDEFGGEQLDAISRVRVETWHASMRDRPSAANCALRVLSHMYTKARDWRVIDSSTQRPTTGVRKYTEKRRERFLTPEERNRLELVLEESESIQFGHRGHRSACIVAAIRLLALTGMRRAEVLDLQWPMVDYRHRCFRLPDSKTGQKTVPVGKPAIDVVRHLEKLKHPGCPYVVHSSRGTRLHESALGKVWRELRVRAGIPDVRLHDLRHSAASDALMNGVPLAVVGKILGHKQPSTTARYAHIADSVLADAVEVMSEAIVRSGRGAKDRARRHRRDRD